MWGPKPCKLVELTPFSYDYLPTISHSFWSYLHELSYQNSWEIPMFLGCITICSIILQCSHLSRLNHHVPMVSLWFPYGSPTTRGPHGHAMAAAAQLRPQGPTLLSRLLRMVGQLPGEEGVVHLLVENHGLFSWFMRYIYTSYTIMVYINIYIYINMLINMV